MFPRRVRAGRRANLGGIVRRAGMAAALALAASVAGAEDGPVQVELNKLETSGDACRAYLVLRNPRADGLATLTLDLVMFDTDGIIARRLAIEAAPLPAHKTSIKVFDIENLACSRIGLVLLNDVVACADAGGPRTDCLALVETSAKGSIDFIE